MENKIEIFRNDEFGEVRTVVIDNEPWFVAADVCKVLEISNVSDTVKGLDNDEKLNTLVNTEGIAGNPNMTVISEPGLYSIVLRSRKPEAKAFKRWITHEVIPTIRRHGVYSTDYLLDNPDIAIAALQKLKEEREERKRLESTVAVQSQQISELQPKASYYDLVLNCKDLISVSKIAKDYGKSAVWLNEKLAELRVQYRQGNVWLLYQNYAQRGYTSTKTHTHLGSDGQPHVKILTMWTQKGRLFIYEMLKDCGILPLIEAKE